MNKWILSIVAIILISTVITMLLPEGKLNKYIKNFFGLTTIFVIIQPIFSLKNGEFNLNFDDEENQVVFQEKYINFISSERMRYTQENCKKILEEKGFKNTDVNIKYTSNEFGENLITNVTIDLKNSVFIFDSRHIDIIDDIIIPVCEYLEIEEKQVNVIE